jgi:hypothetical protein
MSKVISGSCMFIYHRVANSMSKSCSLLRSVLSTYLPSCTGLLACCMGKRCDNIPPISHDPAVANSMSKLCSLLRVVPSTYLPSCVGLLACCIGKGCDNTVYHHQSAMTPLSPIPCPSRALCCARLQPKGIAPPLIPTLPPSLARPSNSPLIFLYIYCRWPLLSPNHAAHCIRSALIFTPPFMVKSHLSNNKITTD